MLLKEILKHIKEKATGSEQVVVICKNENVPEGFDIHYVNSPINYVNFDGVKLYCF